MSRLIVWAAGMLVLGAVLAAMLMTNVYGDRGRDEVNLSSIHELPVGIGGAVTQPVPLQRAAPFAIELPYQWRGAKPARMEVRLLGADGSLLSDTTETLDNSRAPLWLQPIGDGSYWQHELAAFHSIRLPSSASGTIVLRLTRLDQEPGTLVFFASDLASAQSSPPRPSLVERPGEFLDLESEYGAPGTALAKAPTFVSRVQSLAPPWLPFPVPELLLACMVAAGIFLYTTMLLAPTEEPPAEVLSSTRSR
jgi:hypothetical protein